jgi:uncharacterized Tic20 family protein
VSAAADRRAAVAAHLSAGVGVLAALAAAGRPLVWVGMAAWAGPLIAWLLLRGRSSFARSHAAAALDFNLSVAVYLGLLAVGLRLTGGSPYRCSSSRSSCPSMG